MSATNQWRCPSCFELMDPEYPACHVCSYPLTSLAPLSLAPGSALRGRYILGFGRRTEGAISYYAWDREALRRVRVVECFHAGAFRNGANPYVLGMPYGVVEDFLKKHPGEPLEAFRENGTAYLVYFEPEVYSQRDLDARRPWRLSLFHCPRCLSYVEPGSVCCFCAERAPVPGGLPLWAVLAGKYMVGRPLCHDGDANLYPALTLPRGEIALVREYAPSCTARGGDGYTLELLPDHAGTNVFAKGAEAFLKNASAVSRLTGHGLPGPVEVFRENGTYYAVTPYFVALPLMQYLDSRGPQEPFAALALLRDVFEAVGRLDGAGCFHTRLSPDAIAVTEGGWSVLVSPWGGSVFGRAGPYCEALPRSVAPSALSDVYSMAAIYLTCRTGKRLVRPVDIASLPSCLEEREAAVLSRSLDQENSRRPRSVMELYDLLFDAQYSRM